jgi:sRNA-binding protein
MSKFNDAISVLAAKAPVPLFLLMKETGVAMPMAKSTARDVLGYVPEGARRKVRNALYLITHSKRYLEATITPGAMRYDLDGTAIGPISENHRNWALGRLAAKDAAHRRQIERTARAQSDPKWADSMIRPQA